MYFSRMSASALRDDVKTMHRKTIENRNINFRYRFVG